MRHQVPLNSYVELLYKMTISHGNNSPKNFDEEGGARSICTRICNVENQELITWINTQEKYNHTSIKSHSHDVDICLMDLSGFKQYRNTSEKLPPNTPIILVAPQDKINEAISIDTHGDIEFNEIMINPVNYDKLHWRLDKAVSSTAGQSSQFKNIASSSEVGMYIVNTDSEITYVNPAFEEMTGYSFEEAVGKNPRILKSGEMSDEYYELLWRTLLNGDVWTEGIINKDKNGELFTVKQIISPIISDEGEIQSFIAIMASITNRIEKEDELIYKARALDNAPVGVVIADPKQKGTPIIYVNEKSEEITGYSEDELLGHNPRIFQGEKTKVRHKTELSNAIEREESVFVELRNYKKDGSKFWNRVGMAPIKNDKGEVDLWVGFQQDVTEEKHRLAQFEIMNRWLRHNLRNDMNIIKGMAGVAKKNRTDETKSINKIISTSNKLIRMIEKAKSLNSLIYKDTKNEQVNICQSLRLSSGKLQREYPSAKISINECVDEDIISTTSVELDMAVEELITNAIVHNDKETPIVEIIISETSDMIQVDVIDNGPPIPENEKQVHLDDTQDPLTHGSGLGIWLVNTIVTRSGGALEFYDDSPRGNIVRIVLPKK